MEQLERTLTPWEIVGKTILNLDATLEACLESMRDDVLPEFFIVETRDEDGELLESNDVYKDTFAMIRDGHKLIVNAKTVRNAEAILTAVTDAELIIKQVVEKQTYGDETCGSREAIAANLKPLHEKYTLIASTLQRISDEPEFDFSK